MWDGMVPRSHRLSRGARLPPPSAIFKCASIRTRPDESTSVAIGYTRLSESVELFRTVVLSVMDNFLDVAGHPSGRPFLHQS